MYAEEYTSKVGIQICIHVKKILAIETAKSCTVLQNSNKKLFNTIYLKTVSLITSFHLSLTFLKNKHF